MLTSARPVRPGYGRAEVYTDVVAPATPERSELAFYDRWFVRLINDPRDLPFVHLMLQCALLAAGGVGLFFAGEWIWYLAPVYLLLWGFGLLDRFILMLHCTSHRILFKRQYAALNPIIPWVLGPFFGETPETYFTHHMGMHHPENNLEDDLSSTMKYQRDRLTHWLAYFFDFLFVGLPKLALYQRRRGNSKLMRRMLMGEIGFWIAVAGLAYLNWQATLVVFAGPVLLVRALMYIGNWGQHAFVDGSDPGNAYRNSITCINTRYNARCFNDGYHIYHHVKPRAHWSELPGEFERNRTTYGKEDAIVFEGIDFFQVWLYLMLGRFDWLASRFVQLPGAPERDRDEVIALLRSRVQAIPS